MLALTLLIIALGLGIYLFKAQQNSNQIAISNLAPSNIQAVNITDTSSTIIWQTNQLSKGLVSFGTSDVLGDEANDTRDNNNSKPFLTHFVTLKNLTPDTQYFYKVRSDVYFYPDKPLAFKTAKSLSSTSLGASYNKPVFGVILNQSLNPIDEAIVLLNLNGASKLATVTTTAGNFILPLVDLRTNDLTNDFPITQRLNADLIITRGDVSSDVKIKLPQGDKSLPNIVLGQNSDFSYYETSPSAKLSILDVNSDGVVNALDKSIVLENIGKRLGDPGFDSAADLNNDGIIDQKDLDIIKSVVK